MKIKAIQEMMNDKEGEINKLEIEIEGLNERYKNSYTYKLFDYNSYLEKEYIRVDILNRIDEKRKRVVSLRNSIEKNKKMYKLFYNCYYYVDKAIY